jgi:hypothetical protein
LFLEDTSNRLKEGEEMHKGTTATKYCRGEIIAMSVVPRVMGFDYQPLTGKSIYEKKN